MFSACAGVSSIASHTLAKRSLLIGSAPFPNLRLSYQRSWASRRLDRGRVAHGRVDIQLHGEPRRESLEGQPRRSPGIQPT